MHDIFERILYERYPTIFAERRVSPTRSLMCFGLCCDNGWFALIDKLCADIVAMEGHETFKACQVKEKFGGLRFYGQGGTEEIHKRVSQAEDESYKTCEHCGVTTGVTCTGRYWVRSLCDVCRPLYDGEAWPAKLDWHVKYWKPYQKPWRSKA